jgi:lipopolysaccharide export system permease protein
MSAPTFARVSFQKESFAPPPQMKRLHRFMLGSYIGPFVLSFLISMFILEMQFLWKYVDDLMGKGLETAIILELLLYASSSLVNLALPLAILLSSIMTMGGMAENYELTAMKSAGMSLFKILRPLTVFIVLIGTSAFFFSNNVLPVANLKFKALLYSVRQKKPTFMLQSNVFYNGIEGYSIRVGKVNQETGELDDVLIYDMSNADFPQSTVIRAKKGQMDQKSNPRYLVLTLKDGYSYNEQQETGSGPGSYPHMKNKFEENILRIDLSGFSFSKADESLFKNSYEMMSIKQLDASVDSIHIRAGERLKDMSNFLNTTLFLTRDSLRTDTVTRSHSGGFMAGLTFPQKLRANEIAREYVRQNRGFAERVDMDKQIKEMNVTRHLIEWHRKFFFGLACIVLFFIGAPLGAIIRKGGLGLPTVVAILFFLVYYVITIVGEKMAKSGSIDAWFGMWLGTAFLVPISIFLTYKASRDSSIMDRDSYIKFGKRIAQFFKNGLKSKPSQSA